MGVTWIRILISTVAAVLIALRVLYPDIKVAAITIGLLFVAVLP